VLLKKQPGAAALNLFDPSDGGGHQGQEQDEEVHLACLPHVYGVCHA
jgi:hypothetical protein